MFKVIAHRGASADAEDNSAKAFELAISQNADLIETDVRLTTDGILVLEHDASINGLEVQYSTFESLQNQKPHLLSLAAALRQFGDQLPFCFEVKAPGIERAMVQLIRDLLPETLWTQTQLTSFHLPSAISCQQLAPSNAVGWLTREWSREAIELVTHSGLSQICPRAESVVKHPELVRVAKDAGLMVRVWLVESPEWVAQLDGLGIYGGTVNFPGTARLVLNQKHSGLK